jgi:hypothetical protein
LQAQAEGQNLGAVHAMPPVVVEAISWPSSGGKFHTQRRRANKLHWSLDVALREDACKIHRGQAAENLARMRHIALNYLKGETRFKGGIRRKQKKAALDETYLADILAV